MKAARVILLLAAISTFAGCKESPTPGTETQPGERRGGCECKVTATCINESCKYEFDAAKLAGMDDAALEGLADDVVAKCKDQFRRCGPGDSFVRDQAIKGFKEIQSKQEEAKTIVTAPAFAGQEVVCVVENGNGGEVKITFCSPSIQLLPKSAGAQLKAHEDGHAKIQDDYCAAFAKFLEGELTTVICAKKYASKEDLGADVMRILRTQAAFRKFAAAVGRLDDLQKKYDTNTKNGKEGDQAKQAEKAAEISKEITEKVPK